MSQTEWISSQISESHPDCLRHATISSLFICSVHYWSCMCGIVQFQTAETLNEGLPWQNLFCREKTDQLNDGTWNNKDHCSILGAKDPKKKLQKESSNTPLIAEDSFRWHEHKVPQLLPSVRVWIWSRLQIHQIFSVFLAMMTHFPAMRKTSKINCKMVAKYQILGMIVPMLTVCFRWTGVVGTTFTINLTSFKKYISVYMKYFCKMEKLCMNNKKKRYILISSQS